MTDPPFAVILTDPPWAFKTWSPKGQKRSPERHYQTLPLSRLVALQIPTARDVLLILWRPGRSLSSGLALMLAWGFRYASQLIWVKPHCGTGYWARCRHENLLLGVRGRFRAPAPALRRDSVIDAPACGQSRVWLEQAYPELPKLELFSRPPLRVGWAHRGDEVPLAETCPDVTFPAGRAAD